MPYAIIFSCVLQKCSKKECFRLLPEWLESKNTDFYRKWVERSARYIKKCFWTYFLIKKWLFKCVVFYCILYVQKRVFSFEYTYIHIRVCILDCSGSACWAVVELIHICMYIIYMKWRESVDEWSKSPPCLFCAVRNCGFCLMSAKCEAVRCIRAVIVCFKFESG